MVKNLLEILKNRVKVAGVAFLLEITVGVLSEWQRSSAIGELDAQLKRRSGMDSDELDKKLNL